MTLVANLDSAGAAGDLDSAVDGDLVWMTCVLRLINRSADDD